MDVPVNTFKRALKEGRQQIGLWSSLSSHVTVEILAGAGFDWILLDTEHAPNDLPMVYSQLQAAASGGRAHPVVRLPWNDPVIIKRFLDAGTQSLLLPMIETEAEAKAAVAATRYPPHGIRGFAAASRASRFGRVKDYHAHAHEELCVLVQVETKLGLDNLGAIAATPGIDGVFIGPGDLSAAIGYLGAQGDPHVVSLIEDTIRAIAKAGNAPGILTPDEALARRYMDAGCLFTAVGSDLGILARGAEALSARFAQKA
jgi:4-hydroxy-2-oxoheptanedioate aldolase